MRQPWLKFYPADWRQEPGLRMCSLAARGLWMEMLCLMWQAEPCGSLLVNGKQVAPRLLAPLVGTNAKECEGLILELEEAGVFSRDDDGTIYSRRMRKDIRKAEVDRENGKGGGNPGLKSGVNPPDKPEDNGVDKAQKLEARSKKEETRAARAASFERFWAEWPNKVGKPAAEKAFERVADELDEILFGVRRYVRSKPADRSWMNPATFLNQRRWEDRPASSAGVLPLAPPNDPADPRIPFDGGVSWPTSSVKRAVESWQRDASSWPVDVLGWPPGSPGCRVPKHLLPAGLPLSPNQDTEAA